MCRELWYITNRENHRAKGGFTLRFQTEGIKALQTKERRAIQCMLHIRI